ncbi:MAG TPA: penicillin-binding protein 2 [bacterium]|nr:penicillin-binding protein 2 [bacterium]
MVNNKNNPFEQSLGPGQGRKKIMHLTSANQRWTEEVFLGRDDNTETISHNFNINRGHIFSRICLALLVLLLGRLIWLQLYRGEYYYNLSEGNRLRLERLEAKRGIIYDSQHRPLVQNVANFLVYVNPSILPTKEADKQAVTARLAEVLGEETCSELEKTLATIKPRSLEYYQPIFVSDNLTYEQAIQLTVQAHQLPGVVLTNRNKRSYLSVNNLAGTSTKDALDSLSLILGYIGKINEKELAKNKSNNYLPIDYIGKTGLEAYYEQDLRGVNGSKQIEIDAVGNEKKMIGQQNPLDGHHLVLTIDAKIQANLERVVREHLKRINGRKAVAIAMNPQDGSILAMVNQPSFDNNQFSSGIKQGDYQALINDKDKPMFNRAISGEYPSGSTVKVVIAAGALQEGVINEKTGFNSVGGLRIGQWSFPDWKAGGHGWTNVTKAIAESVNTFFYYIGGGYDKFVGLGLEKIDKYLNSFGLGAISGIDLSGEATGLVPTAAWKKNQTGEQWYIGDTYHLAIGQGYLLVTPLQVADYTAIFANGGKLYQPHLVKEILGNDESVYQTTETRVIRQNMVSTENIKIVRDGMRQTVLAGSARSLQILPVAVAGKTGTAQFGVGKETHSWFTGFAPFDNPEMTLTILVEGGGESTDAAVPIARDFWQWYFKDKVKINENQPVEKNN